MVVAEADWEPHGIKKLEKAARKALRAGSASVAAGPGSGKSEFLAQRASFLFETGRCPHPQQILAIAFKRSAAQNLRERVATRLPDFAPRFSSMTFDAFTKVIVDRFANILPDDWKLDGGYRIGFSSRREVESFLDGAAAAAPAHFKEGVRALRADQFLSKHVGATPIGANLDASKSPVEFAVKQWWSTNYQGKPRPTLDFIMVNRLAELIIRSSTHLRTALAATYPFVFVDEFQDTTYAQYAFLKEVFAGTDTQVTVVGDRNQRIMGWAGALDDAFEEFVADFGAESFALTSNYRSSPELVELQHRFAKVLNPEASKQNSKILGKTGDAAAQVWSFADEHDEASKIAEWIRKDIDDSDRPASQYALLARQQVAQMEGRFREAFEEHGLRIRNDDAMVGDIRLQDLLGDELARLCIDTIRLGASVGGEPDAWIGVTQTLATLSDSGRNRRDTWEDRLSAHLAELRLWFSDNSNALPATTNARALTQDLMERFTAFISIDELSTGRRFGETTEEVTMKLKATALRLVSVLETATSWDAVADAFREDDAVPLMTIHRSKGLEYHTVFIVGLDDAQWWSHANDSIGSTMTFFVGVSRAAERIIFTHTTSGVTRRKVDDLYAELEAAGVPFLDMS